MRSRRAAAASSSSGPSRSAGSPAKLVSSPAPISTATRLPAPSLRAAKTRAARESGSQACASSTHTSRGRSEPSSRSRTRSSVGVMPSRSTRSGGSGSGAGAEQSRACSPLYGSRCSAGAAVADSTGPVRRSRCAATALSRSAVRPTPGSAVSTSAPPSPLRSRTNRVSRMASSPLRPYSRSGLCTVVDEVTPARYFRVNSAGRRASGPAPPPPGCGARSQGGPQLAVQAHSAGPSPRGPPVMSGHD